MSKSKQHSLKLNRRTFLQTTALAAGAVAFGVPTLVRGQNLNSKLNIAAVGIGGKGSSDIDCSATENIVALCDVDTHYSAGVVARYPQAKFYGDYRKMFDEMGTGIDGVIVATPDHMHAIVASAAMRQGKHVYCQKPLTQTIYEARYLRNLAHDSKVVTQMGIPERATPDGSWIVGIVLRLSLRGRRRDACRATGDDDPAGHRHAQTTVHRAHDGGADLYARPFAPGRSSGQQNDHGAGKFDRRRA